MTDAQFDKLVLLLCSQMGALEHEVIENGGTSRPGKTVVFFLSIAPTNAGSVLGPVVGNGTGLTGRKFYHGAGMAGEYSLVTAAAGTDNQFVVYYKQ